MNGIYLTRKSVRTYDGNGLPAEDIERLEKYAESIENPFGVPVTFRFLDAAEHGLSSPVLAGEKVYAAATVERVPQAAEAYGYSFEKFVLYAWSLGIGTVWIGGTMDRAAFERAVGLKDNEMMPCVTPLGRPAKKRSIREGLMRKGVKADDRKPLGEMFFDGQFGVPLTDAGSEALNEAIEAVRWAPSAVNKQPWRIVRAGDVWHFYEKHDKGYVNDKVGDLQRIDVGIALCHFISALEEAGLPVSVDTRDPGLDVPPDTEYITSVRVG